MVGVFNIFIIFDREKIVSFYFFFISIRQLDALKLLLRLVFFPLLREDHKNPLDFCFLSGHPIEQIDWCFVPEIVFFSFDRFLSCSPHNFTIFFKPGNSLLTCPSLPWIPVMPVLDFLDRLHVQETSVFDKVSLRGVKSFLPFCAWLFPAYNKIDIPILYLFGLFKLSVKVGNYP